MGSETEPGSSYLDFFCIPSGLIYAKIRINIEVLTEARVGFGPERLIDNAYWRAGSHIEIRARRGCLPSATEKLTPYNCSAHADQGA